ncbi:Efflux pump membrane transporter BepE [Polystyrenella longa]|uniref:Efflux pump membrane transporter BepE n=1 Tax=Polystyrenella longa TaxID=2528007 RepID=A0A518CHF0_9PLAN|nr:multidrug efflux RND transporter permease subunit [Polystyrenella longa]QDU78653.1 Efflux pump membrane transporter BepE [Polystyrenella longa]
MFSHFFINRPIFATVLSIVIVILGSVAYLVLPVAQYPEVTPPTIQVSTIYPGANAESVADTVATPIEQEINGVEDMLYLSSSSTNDGQMNIDVTFKVGTDIDMAQVNVQNRVAIAMPKLPEEVTRQGVTTKKRSPSLLMCVNIVSPDDTYDELYLSNYVTIRIRDALARVEGVGDLIVWGARDYSMRVWLDPSLLAARDMTAGDVLRAVREQNVQVAAGQLGQPPVPTGEDFQFTINTKGRLKEVSEFEQIVVKTGSNGETTHLKDVARIELGAKNYDISSLIDGKPTVTLGLFQLPGSNALDTATRIREQMETLKKTFPTGLDYKIVYDTTGFIEQSINDVFVTLFQALGLVFLVVLIFLQSWRATIIPMVAVPVSLIGTFAGMAFFGFSLNNLSLFGLVLAIGVVVDDAIVIVESVQTHLANGLSSKEASRRAMTELFGPVIATSLVLLAVFIPTAFMSGITGAFFSQFALTIAAAVTISTFNALTLSPALCALLLKPETAKQDPLEKVMDFAFGWFFKFFNKGMNLSRDSYAWIVRLVVRGSMITLFIYGGLLYLTYIGYQNVPQGFIPAQDKGYLIINAQLPDAASKERTSEVIDNINDIVLNTPGVGHTISMTGFSLVSSSNLSNAGTVIAVLDPFEERKEDKNLYSMMILQKLMGQFSDIKSAQVIGFGPPPVDGVGSTGGFKLQIQDVNARGGEALQAAVEQLGQAATAQPGIASAFTTTSVNQPQLFLDIDREKAKTLGVSLNDLFETLQINLGSAYVNDFSNFGRNWQVIAQAEPKSRIRKDDIGRLKVRNSSGDMVPIATMVTIAEITGPSKISHFNLFRTAELNGNPEPGFSSGDSISIMDQLFQQKFPTGEMGFEWTELTLQEIIAGVDPISKLVFPMAVIFVFLVLAAQYESWSLPLAVILIVPMCLLCSIAGVWLVGMDNNVFTQIGQVLLVGLSAKNAILIVEFARARQDAGMSRFDAVVDACRLRLRPILMTAFSSVLGFLPLVLASGAGAEMRFALGIGVVSGMLGVTFFGLFLTPVFYSVIMKFADRKNPENPEPPLQPEPAPQPTPKPAPTPATTPEPPAAPA